MPQDLIELRQDGLTPCSWQRHDEHADLMLQARRHFIPCDTEGRKS